MKKRELETYTLSEYYSLIIANSKIIFNINTPMMMVCWKWVRIIVGVRGAVRLPEANLIAYSKYTKILFLELSVGAREMFVVLSYSLCF